MIENIPSELVDFLLKKGVMQPNEEDLPYNNLKKDKNGRSFHTTWYWKEIPGKKILKGIG